MRARLRLPRPTLADGGLVAMVALLCSVIVMSAAVATTWLRVSADDMAAEIFGAAPWPARQLQVVYTDVGDQQVPAGAAAEVHRSLAPPLQEVFRAPRHAATLVDGIPQALPRRNLGGPAFLTVVGFPDVRDQIEIVEGSFPRRGDRVERLPRAVAAAYDGPRRAAVVEVALERSAATALNLPVGTYVEVNPYRYAGPTPERPTVMRVSGTYEATAPRPAPIDDVPNVRDPAVSTLPEMTTVRAAALTADAETLLSASWRGRPEVRWTFDPAGPPRAAEVDEVAAESRRLAVQPWPPVLDSQTATATTGVGDLSSSFLDERRASDALAALALATLAAAGLAVLVVAASVLELRRRDVTGVLRARGASTSRLLLLRAAEGLLLVAPGLIGALVLIWLGPAGGGDLVPALGATALCVALLSAVQVAPWQGLPERVRLAARDALQLTVVALAVGGSVLMLQRDRLDAADPLLLALPAVVGIAASVLVVRSVQRLTSLLRRLAAGGARLGPVVGLSQAGAAAAHAVLPVVAVVLAGSAALLTVAVDDTVARAADRTAWQEVGADVTVEGAAFTDDLLDRLRQVPGATGVAGVQTTSRASLDTRVGRRQVSVVAVDRDALHRVTQAAPEQVRVPASRDGELAVLASADLDLEAEASTLDYAQAEVPVVVAGRSGPLPGVGVESPFVVVDLDAFRAAVDRVLPAYDTLLLSGTPDPAAVRSLVREISPTATVRTRAAVTAGALEGEVVTRTLGVVRAVAVGGSLLAVFGAVLAVLLGRPGRRRTRLLLRDLGADVRQARWTTALELVPVMIAAGLAALGCGLLLVLVVGGGVDLGVLTGAGVRAQMGLDGVSWFGAVGAVVLLVGLVVAASTGENVRGRRPGGRRTAGNGRTR